MLTLHVESIAAWARLVPAETRDRLGLLASLPADQRTAGTGREFRRLFSQAVAARRDDDTLTEPRVDADHLALARRLEQRIAA